MRTRSVAFVALRVMTIVQIIWTTYYCLTTRPAFASVYYAVIFTPIAAALAVTGGRVRWVATVARLIIGLAFFENVIDRLGVLGPPGATGVSWSDFQHFIAYTAQVNAFAPAAIVPALAVMATIAEGTVGSHKTHTLRGLKVPFASPKLQSSSVVKRATAATSTEWIDARADDAPLALVPREVPAGIARQRGR